MSKEEPESELESEASMETATPSVLSACSKEISQFQYNWVYDIIFLHCIQASFSLVVLTSL